MLDRSYSQPAQVDGGWVVSFGLRSELYLLPSLDSSRGVPCPGRGRRVGGGVLQDGVYILKLAHSNNSNIIST